MRIKESDWGYTIPEKPSKLGRYQADERFIGRKYRFLSMVVEIVRCDAYTGFTVVKNLKNGLYTDYYSFSMINQIGSPV